VPSGEWREKKDTPFSSYFRMRWEYTAGSTLPPLITQHTHESSDECLVASGEKKKDTPFSSYFKISCEYSAGSTFPPLMTQQTRWSRNSSGCVITAATLKAPVGSAFTLASSNNN
jgi:hypothetical protein